MQDLRKEIQDDVNWVVNVSISESSKVGVTTTPEIEKMLKELVFSAIRLGMYRGIRMCKDHSENLLTDLNIQYNNEVRSNEQN